MTKTIKGKPYSITSNPHGWGVVSLENATDRFYRSYQVFRARNGAPVSCSCPDQTNRGGVCKHMNAILDLFNDKPGESEQPVRTSYEEECDWYALHGDPARDAMEYEIAARHDSIHERGYDRDICGEMESFPPTEEN